MTPRLHTGKGASGAVRYVLGEGRDAKTGELKPPAAEGERRVAWISGTGFGFEIRTEAQADLARRCMEFSALNQGSKTRKCEKDCLHLSLAWNRGENPSQAEMEAAAHDALKALGMGNAEALFVAHNDEDYSHVHIVASMINPATNRAYNLKASYRTLSTWAEGYEREHGGVICTRREDMNELRRAIADRNAEAVLEALTKQQSTFTPRQLSRALEKEMPGELGAEREKFEREILASVNLVALIDPSAKADDAEPWMKMSGGLEALSAEHRESAERSYEIWSTEKNPDAAARYGLASYVQYVQTQWAEEQQQRAAEMPKADRYTTRAVLMGEMQVLGAAAELAAHAGHQISARQQAAMLASEKYATMTSEQANAFRHVTGTEGIALIDGQAGTGKSFTLTAVREAYEGAGYTVIGLGPSNKVAKNLSGDGFTSARTIHSELFALNNGRRTWNAKTVVMVDEAAMIDTKIMAMLTSYAADTGAKLILAGDDRQLSSIDRGGMFGALKQRHGAAEISQVKRQHKLDERRASEMMAEGAFDKALDIYDQKGAIHWTRTQGEARAELLEQWANDSAAAPDKTRFVFAYTNADVATLNADLRAVRKARGELGEDHQITTDYGRASFARGDRIQFNANDRKTGIVNGGAGTIEAIEGTKITVQVDADPTKTITFDAATFTKFRHGYAGTIYAGQGSTLDQTYLYHSEHWKSAASYVALTRHRDKTTLFVARNTAKDIKQLGRQMSRKDERRAASMFEMQQKIEPPRVMKPGELLAAIAPVIKPTAEEISEQQRTATPAVRASEPPEIARVFDEAAAHTTAQAPPAAASEGRQRGVAAEGAEPPAGAATASQPPEIARATSVAAPPADSSHQSAATAAGAKSIFARAAEILGELFRSATTPAPPVPDQSQAAERAAAAQQMAAQAQTQAETQAQTQPAEIDVRLAATLAMQQEAREEQTDEEEQREALQRKRKLSL
jgi:hypothetical protein